MVSPEGTTVAWAIGDQLYVTAPAREAATAKFLASRAGSSTPANRFQGQHCFITGRQFSRMRTLTHGALLRPSDNHVEEDESWTDKAGHQGDAGGSDCAIGQDRKGWLLVAARYRNERPLQLFRSIRGRHRPCLDSVPWYRYFVIDDLSAPRVHTPPAVNGPPTGAMAIRTCSKESRPLFITILVRRAQ